MLKVGVMSMSDVPRLRDEPTLAESQFALAGLTALCAGNRDAIGVLRWLIRKVRPTLLPRGS